MQLNTLTLGRKAITFDIVLNPDADDDINAQESRKVSAREAPLDDLTKAFGALPKVVCEIMGFPSDYAAEMTVDRISVSYTKHGTRAVQLRGKKSLNTIGGELHPILTPFVKIDKPGDGESGEVQIGKDAVKRVCRALLEAERYAKGERSQKILNFEADNEALQAQFGDREPALL
jgi:hypothetical protein